MADKFGLKIGLEGEREFKKALADINRSFRVLGSEMKLVESQFGKNDQSLEGSAAKQRLLNKEIDAQKDKINTLKAALENAATSFGENDRRTDNWRIKLNEAEAALNDMERELDESAESADELGDELQESGKAAESSEGKFKKLGSVLKGVGAAMGTVAVAAGAAAIKLGKEVVKEFGEMEQNLGGSEVKKGEEEMAQSLGFDKKEEFAFFEVVKKQLLEPEETPDGMVAEGGAEYITQDVIDLAKSIALDVADIVKQNYVIDWTINPTKTQDIERAILLMLTKKYFQQIKLEKRKQLVQPLLQLARKHYAVID